MRKSVRLWMEREGKTLTSSAGRRRNAPVRHKVLQRFARRQRVKSKVRRADRASRERALAVGVGNGCAPASPIAKSTARSVRTRRSPARSGARARGPRGPGLGLGPHRPQLGNDVKIRAAMRKSVRPWRVRDGKTLTSTARRRRNAPVQHKVLQRLIRR